MNLYIKKIIRFGFVPIILLAFPYLLINTYGNSITEIYVQWLIIATSLIMSLVYILIIFNFKKYSFKEHRNNLFLNFNYMILALCFFFLLIEDALVYDRNTYMFFAYIIMYAAYLIYLIVYTFKSCKVAEGYIMDVLLSLNIILIPLMLLFSFEKIIFIVFILMLLISIYIENKFEKKIDFRLRISHLVLGIVFMFIMSSIMLKIIYAVVLFALLLRVNYDFNSKHIFIILISTLFLHISLTPLAEGVIEWEYKMKFEPYVEKGLEPIYEQYQEYFDVGVSVPLHALDDENLSYIISHHFNSITAEETMKAEYILDEENRGSYIFLKSDPYVKFAKENSLVVRGHTLNWYNQTPEWFFKENYSDDGKYVSREEMLIRLEAYIKAVLERYSSDEIYAWDVVNEGMEIFSDSGYRESLWYQIIGEDYIIKAFEYARKYSDGEKLFYNDFNIFSNKKKQNLVYDLVKELMEKDLIDGIGIQTHIGISLPHARDIDKTIKRFGELGLEVHITELDVSYFNTNTATELVPNENRLIEQAYRYHELFEIFKDNSEYITSVTFWGIADYHSWLNFYPTNRNNWPLIFDNNLTVKPAYYGIVAPEMLNKKSKYNLYQRIEKSIRNVLDID